MPTSFRFKICCIPGTLAAIASAITAYALSGYAAPVLAVGTALSAAATAIVSGFLLSQHHNTYMQGMTQAVISKADGNMQARLPLTPPADLSELHKALGELFAEIKNQKGTVKSILGGLPVPYLMVDAEERTISTNQATMDMLEIDEAPTSQYGKTLGDVFYNDPTRPTAVGKSIKNGDRFVNLEVAITGHKGGTLDVLANVFPLYDLEDNCIGGFCLYLDMTEIKNKEREITEQNAAIARTAERADSVSEQTAQAADQLSKHIDHTTNGAHEQQRMTEQSVTAMHQINATVADVAKNAADSAVSAGDAREKAQAGSEVMKQMLTAINDVQHRSESLQENLAVLGKQADSIGTVMDVISDIADQTNLLALNAAIEAARAGDAGRGFAVVADEVRKLAEKTTQATAEVGDVVQRIQAEAKRSAESMESAGQEIAQSNDYAHKAGEALEAIVSIVDATADQVHTIAAASEEQSAAVEEISSSMQSINEISSTSAESMLQAHTAVSELTQLSGDLREIISDLAKS